MTEGNKTETENNDLSGMEESASEPSEDDLTRVADPAELLRAALGKANAGADAGDGASAAEAAVALDSDANVDMPENEVAPGSEAPGRGADPLFLDLGDDAAGEVFDFDPNASSAVEELGDESTRDATAGADSDQRDPADEGGASVAELRDANERVAELEAALLENLETIRIGRDQLEAATTELDAVTAERDDFKNRLLRSAADLENFRKRTAREKEEFRKYGVDKIVLELLPVLDNLDRALTHADTADASTIADGVRMVQRQFVGALGKYGIIGFESVGLGFDPTRHEALQQIETPDAETGTVLEEYQKGYFLHERLLRPAMVVVAKKAEAAPGADDDQEAIADAEILEDSEFEDVEVQAGVEGDDAGGDVPADEAHGQAEEPEDEYPEAADEEPDDAGAEPPAD